VCIRNWLKIGQGFRSGLKLVNMFMYYLASPYFETHSLVLTRLRTD
jgi:hypothetical protein